MSFDVIAQKHVPDDDFNPRTYALELLLRVVAPEIMGGIYDIPVESGYTSLLPFHTETLNKKYVPLFDRRPNVPEGLNTVRSQVVRQGQMLFGADTFPSIVTAKDEVRRVLNSWIKEAQVADRMREATLVGSTGSVALHIRALAAPGDPHRIYVETRHTLFLTPTFDPYRPDTLIKITEKYKITGAALRLDGYTITDDDLNAIFWFMREWTEDEEIWYVPWKVKEEKRAKTERKPFSRKVDKAGSTTHNLGFCPWIWIKNLPLGKGVDGSSQFAVALDHAINLDYLESQIVRAVKYTMDPVMVLEKPFGAPGPTPNATGAQGEAGLTKSPAKILVIDAAGEAYYLEISGDGIEKARQVAADLRKAIIEAIHGDRVDPEKVTQGHQGAKSLAMLNQPMIGLCDQLKVSYGDGMERMLRMVLKIAATRDWEVKEELIPAGSLEKAIDLDLNFGNYYTDTPQEMLSDAQALNLNLTNGLISRERGMNFVAKAYNIPNVAAELLKVAEDEAEEDARALKLAAAAAQVKVTEPL